MTVLRIEQTEPFHLITYKDVARVRISVVQSIASPSLGLLVGHLWLDREMLAMLETGMDVEVVRKH